MELVNDFTQARAQNQFISGGILRLLHSVMVEISHGESVASQMFVNAFLNRPRQNVK